MTNLFGEEYSSLPKKQRKKDPVEEAWKRAFQKWANEEMEDEYTHYGMCGYGKICDWCDDNMYGRPCLRALTSYCRENYRTIDYTNRSEEYFRICFDGHAPREKL